MEEFETWNLQSVNNSKEINHKINKRLIWSLITLWSLVVLLWGWAAATKLWYIPNRFDLEILCPWDKYKEIKVISIPQRQPIKVIPHTETNIETGEILYIQWWPDQDVEYKPIIYIYPTVETEINVKLWAPENLLHTYPKYNPDKWWNVIAQPSWDLEDIDTWRKLYALYREWKNDNITDFDEWFVVAWKDTIPFLEEKLAILWLNEREAEEFIVYWLPQMENNNYNLIRFETIEGQNKNMPLNIIPTPDTVIRVMMDWKAIDEPIDIPEQKLITSERLWFTVVEWWWSPRN